MTSEDAGERAPSEADLPSMQERMARLLRLSTVLAESNEAVIRAGSVAELFTAATSVAVEYGGLTMAWVGIVDDDAQRVRPVAVAGRGSDYIHDLEISTRDEPTGQGPSGTTVRTGTPVVTNDIAHDERMAPWQEAAARQGYRSSAAFPLWLDGRVAGVLSVYASEPDFFVPDEVELISRLAANLSFGWEAREHDARRQETEQALTESAARIRHGFDHAAIPAALVSVEGRILEANTALTELFCRPAEELVGADLATFVHPEDRAARLAAREEVLTGGPGVYHQERRYLRPDGEIIWTITSASLVRDAEGQPSYFSAQMQDITARRAAEEGMLLRAAQQAAVATLGRNALSELDLDSLFTTAVNAVAELLDVELVSVLEADPLGGSVRLRAGVGFEEGVVGVAQVSLGEPSLAAFVMGTQGTVVVPDVETEERFPAAPLLTQHRIRSSAAAVLRSDNEVYGLIGAHSTEPHTFSAEDVHFLEAVANVLGSAIARSRIQERMQQQALHDDLTGLPNRTLLEDRVAVAIARTAQHRTGVGVLLADLDRFKMINDSLGHAAGDRVLVEVGARLAAVMRATDTVARMTGDEFAVLCDDITSERDVVDAARRIGAALDAPFHLGGHEIFTSASVGVVYVEDPGADAADIVRDADVAMYHAKATGAGLTVFRPEMRVEAMGRMELDTALRHAIERDELVLHHQPVLDLATGRLTGAEALLRWQHPERGLVPPSEFIPFAEDAGLIIPIGRRVIDQACSTLAVWQTLHPDRGLSIGVNLSVRQLGDPKLVGLVERALQDTGVTPASLALEVTESVLVEDARAAVSVLRRLKDLGVSLVIDDFGTGHSSLAYLKRFPVDALKVDQSFVAGLGTDERDTAIVTATVGLARSLGLRVIAEGVETEAQLHHLRKLGCDAAQGYLISAAVPADDLADLLARDVGR